MCAVAIFVDVNKRKEYRRSVDEINLLEGKIGSKSRSIRIEADWTRAR